MITTSAVYTYSAPFPDAAPSRDGWIHERHGREPVPFREALLHDLFCRRPDYDGSLEGEWEAMAVHWLGNILRPGRRVGYLVARALLYHLREPYPYASPPPEAYEIPAEAVPRPEELPLFWRELRQRFAVNPAREHCAHGISRELVECEPWIRYHLARWQERFPGLDYWGVYDLYLAVQEQVYYRHRRLPILRPGQQIRYTLHYDFQRAQLEAEYLS